MHARAHAASAPDLALFASGWLFPRAKFLAKTAFSALSRAAKPVYGRKTGWLGLFGQRAVLSQPFAQTLSDALRKQGFHQPEVSGYHGAGVTYSAAGHHARRLPGGSAQADVRAANVRRVFTPAKSSSRR
ncbi:hypothetical protein [Chromobacterium violaceum]|uniref:hypothetical protein n=1 Tax=Chromobacterium violaceum TaxID=536 RepID=UPI003DA7BCFB